MREILKVSLGIARDVPILRVKRAHTGVRARSFVYLPLFLNCLFVYVICVFSWSLDLSFLGDCSFRLLLHHRLIVQIFLILRIFQLPFCLFDPCWTGSNVRGAKPVTVYFGKYEDKEEVLRQVIQMGELCKFWADLLSSYCHSQCKLFEDM